MLWLRRIVGWVRWYVLGPTSSVEPIVPPSSPDQVNAFVYHVHQWDLCRKYGQYWYARCIATETCTAKIAC